MKKQTAVEWLHYHLAYLMQTREWRSKDLHIEKFDELFIEALEMEREQMEKAVSHGISNADMTNNRGYFDFDKYYNETYGGEQ